MDNAEFMPCGGDEASGNRIGGLQCMQSVFGSGWVLGGKCPQVKHPEVQVSEVANILRKSQFVHRDVHSVKHLCHVLRRPPVDIDVDDLGVRLPPLCNKCVTCQDCSLQRTELTREEKQVYDTMKQGMTLT